MERSRKKRIVVITVCIAGLIGFFMWFFGIDIIKSAVRKNELRKLSYYIVYDSYHSYHRDTYDIYIMVNNEKEELTINDNVRKIITDSFISKMRDVPKSNPLNGNLYELYGNHDIWVHFLFPSNDLPYGWEQTYMNISYNLQFDDITRSEKATLKIPIGASQPNECELMFE